MKVLIVYLSKHNTTKLYSKWISEEIESDLVSFEDIGKVNFDNYSIVVFGSWVYLDKIKVSDYVVDNWEILKTKKVIVFSSAITQPEDKKTQKIFEDSFPKYIRESIYYFPLWGKLHIDELNFIEKLTLKFKNKFRELNEIDRNRIRPIVVKLYDLKVIG